MSETANRNEIMQGAPKGASPWISELKALLAIGAPMALTQLIQFSVNTVDVVMIGRLGAAPLAAASLGLVIFYTTFVVAFGPAMAVSPMVSHALGANRHEIIDVRRSVRMGLWAASLIFPFAVIVYLNASNIALFLGQPAELARLAGPYVIAVGPSLPFMVGVIVLRNYLAAIDRARAPLLIIILTTGLNAFLNYLLIFGNWGFPRLELAGAGVASAISHAAGFTMLALYVRFEKESARFEIFHNFFKPDWPRLREVLRLGWPIGVTMAFEVMLFNAAVFLMGLIGVNEVAAYQVALNVAAIAFMAPLGLSLAGAVRVGLAAGASDAPRARRAAALTIGVCVAAIMIVAAPVLSAPNFIGGLYLNADDPANTAVLALVARFLPIVAMFALFDATQVAANQCLRGLKDVRAPMVITGVSYWVVGFPLAAWLGLATPLGAVGVWWGLLASLLTAAVLLTARLWMLMRPRTFITPAVQKAA